MVKLVEAFREQALGKVKDPLLGAHNTEVCTSRGLRMTISRSCFSFEGILQTLTPSSVAIGRQY